MISKEIVACEEKGIVAYLKDFNSDEVVLDNYFYSSEKNIFKDFNYSDKEIALILNLTDSEYAELVHKYLNSLQGNSPQAPNQESEQLNQKISELEKKLADSRQYEEAGKKIPSLEHELKKINSELSIFQEFDMRYGEAEKEYSQFSHLSKFNLDKIHEDLVRIEQRILDAEQEILNSKKEHIKYNAKRTEFDRGKIILAIFWTLAVILISIALYILKLPVLMISLAAGIGFFVSGIIIFTAKAEIEYPAENPEHVTDTDALEQEINLLKTKRIKILNLIGVSNTDEFFQTKAQHQSYQKKFNYIRDQRNNVLSGSAQYEELMVNKEKIQSELNTLKQLVEAGAASLSPEEYLAVRREVDALRLRLNQQNQTQALSNDDIKLKLSEIRNELNSKIPDYINILQQTLKNSFESIQNYFSELSSRFSNKLDKISPEGDNYEELSNLNKTLLQYALIKEIYKENFVFVVQFISNWPAEDIRLLTEFMQSEEMSNTKFCIVEKQKN